MVMSSFTGRHWLLAVAGLCIASIAAALVGQYAFDMQPCPYCILQRLVYAVIAVLSLIGAFVPGAGRRLLAGLVAVLALAAGAAALYQHFVAAKSASCAFTFADKIITALRIDEFAPSLFAVRASCADAAVSVLGVPFEMWSLLLAVLALACSITAVKRP